MSLLLPVRGHIPLVDQDGETAVVRLCQGLVRESKVAASAVVAARFEVGPSLGVETILAAARRCGWEGIPLFVARCGEETGSIGVEAHVRVKRRRRFRDVRLDPATGERIVE